MGKNSNCIGAMKFEEKLVAILGTKELADAEARRIASDSFKQVFGDWENNKNAKWADKHGALRQDDNGYPRLFKSGNQFYYKLKNGKKDFLNKIKFPEIDPDDVFEITNQLRYELFSTKEGFDFNNIENIKGLKIAESIQSSIDAYKTENVGDPDAQMRADLIEKYKEDFVIEVRTQIEDMGLTSSKRIKTNAKEYQFDDLIDQNGNPEGEISEEEKSTGMNYAESFTKNSKDTASVNVKLLLSTVLDTRRELRKNPDGTPYVNENGKNEMVISTVPGRFLGKPRFVEFDDVWTTLEPMLADLVNFNLGGDVQDVFELMIEKLEGLRLVKPWTEGLADRLKELNTSEKIGERNKITEFFQAFSKAKLDYYVTEVNGRNLKVINASSTNSRSSKLKAEWGRNFRKKFLTSDGKMNKAVDIEQISEMITESKKKFISQVGSRGTMASKIKSISENLPILMGAMNALGINVNSLDVRNFILQVGDPEKRYGEVKSLYEGMERTMAIIKNDKSPFIVAGEFKNPFDDQMVLGRLATARGLSTTQLSENRIIGNVGKAYWTYSSLSYLHNKLNSWKQQAGADDTMDIQALASLTYNKNSRWLRYLLAADVVNDSEREAKSLERIQDVQIGLSSSMKSKNKNDGVDNTNMTIADAINDSMVKILGKKASAQKSLFPTIVPADKSRKMDISGFEMFETGIVYTNGKGTEIDDATSDIFLDYFEDEINRMAEAADEIDNLPDSEKIEHYHTKSMNALKSQLFPEFSPAEASKEVKSILYDNNRPKKSTISGLSKTQREALRPFVVQAIKDRMKETLQELRKNKIIEVDPKEKGGLKALTIDKTLMSAYESQSSPVHTLVGDYVVNGLISTVEYTKLFSGDPAYYKNQSDLVKRIPATYTDGLQLRLSKNDHKYFNQATVNGVEVASKFLDEIIGSLKTRNKKGDPIIKKGSVIPGTDINYPSRYYGLSEVNGSIALAYDKIPGVSGGVNTTDAQAWITPHRWKFLKERLGQWGAQHEKVFNKMMDGKELDSKELKLAAQPLKGVYFEINDGRPVYLKYSQAVLVPSLVKNTPMQALYNKMTIDPATGEPFENKKDEIHEVITRDGVKVGAKGITDIHSKDGELLTEFELNSTPLINSGWKLQQDLPTKLIHDTLTGSQIQKNILAGIDLSSKLANYELNGEPKTGIEIMQMIHDTIGSLVGEGKKSLVNKFGIGEDNKITNMTAVYEALIDEFKSRGGDENIISALEKEMPFDAIPQLAGRVQSIFMSIFNKELIKVKTNGGSFIQVSPFGLDSVQEIVKDDSGEGPNKVLRSGIKIVSDNYDPKGLKPPRIDKKTGKVLPGQAMLPYSAIRSAIDKHNKQFKDENDPQRINPWNMSAAKLKKILDPSALQMVAYRIPNQGMSSNDALEIVGILPPELGDSIIAYDAVPGKTGSDFDIDKMYVMTHHLEVRDGKIQKIPSDMDSKKGKQNMLVDLYTSVLTSPHTYDQMMTSIDAGFLKNDIVDLFPPQDLGSLQFMSPIQQIKTKFEYLSGKFGVAQTANQLVDHASNQSLNIRLNGYLGIGHKDSKGNTKFDNITDTDGKNSISDVLSAFLNAYVDIAKDPYISRGNHNVHTAGITFMLIRAGAPVSWVNRFVGQPILKDLVDIINMSEGKTARRLTFGKSGKTVTPIEYVRLQYGVKKGDANEQNVAALRESKMEAAIKREGALTTEEKIEQGKILDIFEFLQDHAKDFNASVSAAKADTKGNGGGVTPLHIAKNKVNKVLNAKKILGYASKGFTSTYAESTMMGHYYHNGVLWVSEVLQASDLFLVGKQEVLHAFDGVSESLGKGLLTDPELGRVLENSFRTYSMSGLSVFKDNNLDHHYLFKVLPEKISALKETSDNFLIQELQIETSGGYEFLGIDSSTTTKSFNNRMYRAWSQLLNSSDPAERKLGVDLIRYAYSQSGFNNNLNQFFSHIPHNFFAEQGIAFEIDEMFRTVDKMIAGEDFKDQMLRHQWENKTLGSKLVPELRADKIKVFGGLFSLGTGFISDEEKHSIAVDVDFMGNKTFPKFTKVMLNRKEANDGATPNYGLFILRGEINGNPVYTRTHKLGHKSGKGSIFEYNEKEAPTKSVVEGNNVPVKIKGEIRDIMKQLRSDPGFVEERSGINIQENTPSEGTQGQEERILPSDDYQFEELQMFNAKIAHLQSKMNVDVIMDSTVPTSRVLGASDPRTISAGKPVILINPKAIFKTTAIHEFAHIFIDAFPGGLKNKRLQKALQELKGTALYDEVKEGYSELSNEMFEKELLATAIGREGADIWDSNEKGGMWTAFKNWFFDFLRRVFGLNQSEVSSLTKELLNNTVKTDLLANLSAQDQQEKNFGQQEKDEEVVELENTYSQIVSSIANLRRALKPQSTEELKIEESKKAGLDKGEKTKYQEVKDLDDKLTDEMSRLNETANSRAMIRYVAFSQKSVNEYKSLVGRLSERGKLTPEDIKNIKFFTSVFNMIPDVKQLMLEQYEKGFLKDSNGQKKKRMAVLDKIIADYDTLNQEMLGVSRRIYAQTMVEHSNEHVTAWRKKFEKQYADLESRNATPDENIYVWVNAKMTANKDKIKSEALKFYENQAKKSLSDIHASTGWLVSEKNIANSEIQTVSRMIGAADFEVDRWVQAQAKEVEDSYKDFSKDYPSSFGTEERNKKFVDQTDEGSYFISEYKADFLAKYYEANSWMNKNVYEEKFAGIEVTKDGKYKYNGETKELLLPRNGLKVEGTHVFYTEAGITHSMTLQEAIGKSERAYWIEENTDTQKKSYGLDIKPKKSIWANPAYEKLSAKDKVHLKFMKDKILKIHKLTDGKNSLIEKAGVADFYRLPGVTRSSKARALAGDLKSLVSDSITDMFKKKEDEFELEAEGAKAKEKGKSSIRRMADLTNKQKYDVPINLRAKLSKADQSLDIHTILVMALKDAKNYEQKKKLEATVNVFIDVMSNRLIPNHSGLQKLAVMHGFNRDKEIQMHLPKDQLPEDVKTLISIMESRIYGIKEKDAGEIAGVNMQKATTTLLKYAGSVALIGNFVNSFVNATTGTVNNLIEAWGGETYNINNWKNAGLKYWKDSKGIVDDLGSNVHSSRTNMMLDVFNVLGSRESLNNNFEDNSRLKAIMKTSSLRPIAQGGEHMMQSKVMYAVLDGIKVLNKKGEYLDKNGNVTKDVKNAVTLDEAMYFERDKKGESVAKLPFWASATTFSPQPGNQDEILVDARDLIKKKIIDLHGNYDNDLKNKAQREWWGKLLFFLKKWMESTTLRRFRGYATALKKSEELRDVDKYYSEDMKQYQEGYYVTAARFIKNSLIPAAKELKFEIITADYKNMSKHEKANMRRLVAEFGMMTLTLLAYAAMGGFDDEPDDDTLMARYFLRRELAELSFYLNPAETIKLMKNPTASISVIERYTKVLGQFMAPTERYEQGKNEGRLKLWVKIKKALPYWAQTEKDYEASMRFLQVMD